MAAIGVTDHDSTEGLDAGLAAGRDLDIEVVPGVEINTDVAGGEVHLLGYFIDWRNAALQQTLSGLRHARLDRARRMVDKLTEMGRPVSMERVLEIAGGGSVGRPHLAQAIVEKGYARTFQEAFDLYIGRQGPAYAGRTRLTPAEAVQLILQAGGIPVLAHPRQTSDLVPGLVEAGLQGLECYYGNYAPEDVEGLLAVARRYGLQPTGGSDFHGPGRLADLGGTPVPTAVLDGLKALSARGQR